MALLTETQSWQTSKYHVLKEGITAPSTSVMVYPSLVLSSTKSTITARMKSQSTKHDNSEFVH